MVRVERIAINTDRWYIFYIYDFQTSKGGILGQLSPFHSYYMGT